MPPTFPSTDEAVARRAWTGKGTPGWGGRDPPSYRSGERKSIATLAEGRGAVEVGRSLLNLAHCSISSRTRDPTTIFLTATTLIYATGARITAAAGVRTGLGANGPGSAAAVPEGGGRRQPPSPGLPRGCLHPSAGKRGRKD